MDYLHSEWYKGELHIRLDAFFPTTKHDCQALCRIIFLDFCKAEDIFKYLLKWLDKQITDEKMLHKHPDQKRIKKLQKNLDTVQQYYEKYIL